MTKTKTQTKYKRAAWLIEYTHQGEIRRDAFLYRDEACFHLALATKGMLGRVGRKVIPLYRRVNG